MANKDNYGAEIGKRITCQVCNKQIFLRQTGYSNIDAVAKDRHSLSDQFEPIPNGWEIKHDLGGWTCPSCIEHYTSTLEKFKSKYGEGSNNG